MRSSRQTLITVFERPARYSYASAIGKLKMEVLDIDVHNRILVLVNAVLEQNAIVTEVGPDSSLVDIGLTSMDMVSLMLGVEAEFDFTIPQDQITPENFQSIATLERMIRSQIEPSQLQGVPAG
jgi:acyl carrier protein